MAGRVFPAVLLGSLLTTDAAAAAGRPSSGRCSRGQWGLSLSLAPSHFLSRSLSLSLSLFMSQLLSLSLSIPHVHPCAVVDLSSTSLLYLSRPPHLIPALSHSPPLSLSLYMAP